MHWLSIDIDFDHSGLICRATPHCRLTFRVRGDQSTDEAAALRDAHEWSAHRYRHHPIADTNWSFTQRFSQRGKSTVNLTSARRRT